MCLRLGCESGFMPAIGSHTWLSIQEIEQTMCSGIRFYAHFEFLLKVNPQCKFSPPLSALTVVHFAFFRSGSVSFNTASSVDGAAGSPGSASADAREAPQRLQQIQVTCRCTGNVGMNPEVLKETSWSTSKLSKLGNLRCVWRLG